MANDASESATQHDGLLATSGATSGAANEAGESYAGAGHTVSRRSFVGAAALAGAGLIAEPRADGVGTTGR